MAKDVKQRVVLDVVAETKKFRDGMSKAGKEAAVFAGKVSVAVLAAGKAYITLAQRVSDLRNAISDMSTKTGVSTSTLQGLKLAAEGAGLEFNALESLLVPFPKRLADVARGTGEAKGAFEALGVSATDADGNLRSTDEVLRELVAKLQSVEDPTTKAALATQLFGESGGKLLQAVGGKELGEFVAFAERFGVGVGPQAAAAAAEWQRQTAELSTVLEGMSGDLFDAINGTENMTNATRGLVAVWAGLKAAVNDASVGLQIWATGLIAIPDLLAGNTKQIQFYQKVIENLKGQLSDGIGPAMKSAAADFNRLSSSTKSAATTARGVLIPAMGGVKDSMDALTPGTDEAGTALQDLKAVWEESVSSLVSDEQRLQMELQKRIDKIRELGKVSGEVGLAEATIANEQLAFDEAKAEREDKRLKAFVAQKNKEAQKFSDAEEQKRAESIATANDVANVSASITGAIADMANDALERTINFEGAMTDRRKKMALRAFAGQKAINIANAISNTALAVTSALATPPFPLGLALSAVAGVQGAVQVGMIAAQQPPSFHLGSRAGDLAPDETMAKLTRREVVLTPQGAADANAGMLAAGGEGGTLALVMGTDVFDIGVKRAAKRLGGSIRRSRVGHRRRR